MATQGEKKEGVQAGCSVPAISLHRLRQSLGPSSRWALFSVLLLSSGAGAFEPSARANEESADSGVKPRQLSKKEIVELKLKEMNDKLLSAVQNGDPLEVKGLLDNGADPNANDGIKTALMLAATASDHSTTSSGESQSVTDVNRDEIVRLLLARGANPNVGGETALYYAVFDGRIEAVRHLLAKNLDRKVKDDALSSASYIGNPDIVRMLLDSGANPNVKDGFSKSTALCKVGYAPVARLLLDKGANPNASCGEHGYTPLMTAYWIADNTELISLLLERGANPNARDKYGETALMHAAEEGEKEVVRLLLTRNPDQKAKDAALRKAAYQRYQGCTDVIQLLLDKGANPNTRDENDRTVLMVAIDRGQVEAVRLLLEKGAKADPDIEKVMTKMIQEDEIDKVWRAIVSCNLPEVKNLLDKGVDPNARDKSGIGLLIKAVELGQDEIVKTFLEKGADPNLKNKDGETALSIAEKKGYITIAELLLEKGGKK